MLGLSSQPAILTRFGPIIGESNALVKLIGILERLLKQYAGSFAFKPIAIGLHGGMRVVCGSLRHVKIQGCSSTMLSNTK